MLSELEIKTNLELKRKRVGYLTDLIEIARVNAQIETMEWVLEIENGIR